MLADSRNRKDTKNLNPCNSSTRTLMDKIKKHLIEMRAENRGAVNALFILK